ncbi:MAG: hypothetical protein J5879_05460 [Clostridia bacterium]|nr:hypothetical protein [Clostridia bacterium]
MKKIISVAIIVILTAALALSADAASIANHLFDKQGGVDAGGKTWSVYGWIVTDADITSVGYILDEGDINSYKAVVTGIENDTRDSAQTKKGVSDAYRDLELEEAVKGGGMSAGVSWDIMRAYRIQIVIDMTELEEGQHIVLICVEFLGGGIAEAFRSQSEFSFTKSGSGNQTIDGKGASTVFLIDSDESDETKIEETGWAGSTVKTVKLGYKIDKGETVFNDDYVKLIELDETDPGDIAVMNTAGQYAFRFRVNFPLNEMPAGEHYIKLIMIDEDGGETVVGSAGGKEELMFYYEREEEETSGAATEPETTVETGTVTESQAVSDTEEQSAPATTDAPGTEETTENKDNGFPWAALIPIAAAVIAAIVAVVIVLSKKKNK